LRPLNSAPGQRGLRPASPQFLEPTRRFSDWIRQNRDEEIIIARIEINDYCATQSHISIFRGYVNLFVPRHSADGFHVNCSRQEE
jgi:hypothetical protein